MAVMRAMSHFSGMKSRLPKTHSGKSVGVDWSNFLFITGFAGMLRRSNRTVILAGD